MSVGLGTLVTAAYLKDAEDSTFPQTNHADDALGASDAIPILSETMTYDTQKENDAVLQAKAGLRSCDEVGKRVQGGITVQARYNDIGRLICAAMGWENPNTAGATYHGSPETVTAKSKHVIELDDILHRQTWTLDGDRLPSGQGGGTWDGVAQKVRTGNLIIAKQVTDWKFNSVAIDKMSVKIDPSRVALEFSMIGYNHSRGAYNHAAFTFSTDQTNVIWPQLVFTLSGSAVGITKAEINLDNHLEAEADTASGLYIKEPMRGAMRDVTFGFDLARYESDTRLDDLDIGTERYASFVFTSGTYVLGFYFSAFKFEKIDAPVPGSGIIKMSHQCRAYRPASDQFSAQWSNISLKKNNEMVCMMMNDHSSNYLLTET